MKLFHKKKDKDESLVLDDFKEEFSWSVFWDEQVVGRIKKIHDFLKDHGILFFLLSPFQYKNRLITKLVLIFLGIMIGIVPRSISMVNAVKARNAASELAEAQATSVGKITVSAMKSSQYKRQHVLIFKIDGDTKDGVPSTTSDYSVTLTSNRGVDDPQNVSYKYKVLPIDNSSRMLVVYVDNQKQHDNTGIYNLDVHIKGSSKMDTPIEVVLSDSQKTNQLFNSKAIKLAALSEQVVNQSNDASAKNAIAAAKKDLNHKLNVYKLNEQRLKQMGMAIKPTYSQVKALVDKYSVLTYIGDKSSVDSVDGKTAPDNVMLPDMSSSIAYKGKTYSTNDDNTTTDNSNSDNDDDNVNVNNARDTELPQVSQYLSDVLSAISALNTARQNKFAALSNVEEILTENINPNHMGKRYWVKN